MTLLMDTHCFLWFVGGSPKLSAKARSLIEDRANDKLLSIASMWEMAIKVQIGKLTLSQPFDQFIPQQLLHNGFKTFDITFEHIAEILELPLHHRDPFDRLLAAQCRREQFAIVSADAIFDAYGIQRFW